MMKKALIGTVVVFIAWSAMDFVLHGLILRSAYAATAALWRPQAEMKMGLLYLSIFLTALSFCWMYAKLVAPKNPGKGFQFGLWFGIAVGLGMGIGSYSVEPIPGTMALAWFLGSVVEGMVAGLIAGALIKE